jgi:hypothetical protein
MKRTVVSMVLGIFVMLLSLQLSCATAKKDQEYNDSSVTSGQAQAVNETSMEVKETQATEGTSANVEETSTGALLLGDKHKAAGVACNDCHAETLPANEVPKTVCLTCHEDYKKLATSSIDPHNAHKEFSECGDCHHSHKVSENQCLGCHSFYSKIP